jgi:Tfp pilus assembly protein PilF
VNGTVIRLKATASHNEFGSCSMRRALCFLFAAVLVVYLHSHAEAQTDRGRAYFDLGVFAYEDGDYQSAADSFKKALQFNPDNPQYQHYLGKTYMKMERFSEAGEYLNKAWKANPDMFGLKYDVALLDYKTSSYSEAADLFIEIARDEPTNVLAHYYAGMSLYKQERYQSAVEYFSRVAEKSPNLKDNVYFYSGTCYWHMGEYPRAVERFEYVRDHADSASLREYATRWLEAIERHMQALKRYRIYFKVGYQYDDNVQLEPLDEDIYANEGDFGTRAYFAGSYDLVQDKDYRVGVGYSHYQTKHNRLEEYDLIGSTFFVYAKYFLEPFTIGFNYLPSYYWLDSRSFLMRHQINPEITWQIHRNLAAILSYSYYRNKYFQEDSSNGHTNEVFLDLYYNIGEYRQYLFGGVGYEDNSASSPDNYYTQWKTRIGICFKVIWDSYVNLYGRYYHKEYDNVDSYYGVKRQDDKYYGSIALSRHFFYRWLTLVAEFNYTKNDSNINHYTYEDRTVDLSLAVEY